MDAMKRLFIGLAVAMLIVSLLPMVHAGEPAIQHVVIIFKENHTFDDMFGTFPGADGDPLLSHHNESDIPYQWMLVENYTLCDNYYTSSPDASFPNHFLVVAAWAPFDYDPSNPWTSYYYPDRLTLADLAEQNGLSWRTYMGGAPGTQESIWWPIYDTHSRLIMTGKSFGSSHFFDDMNSGFLANVTWVAPIHSDHPPGNVTLSDSDTWNIVKAVMNSKYWESTAIFITEDDWGGLPDHLSTAIPEYHDGANQTWHRVPCTIVSPWARKGYISDGWYEHTSIVRFAEEIFNLPSLTERDGSAGYFQDAFTIDLAQNTSSAEPPILLIAAVAGMLAILVTLLFFLNRKRRKPLKNITNNSNRVTNARPRYCSFNLTWSSCVSLSQPTCISKARALERKQNRCMLAYF